MCCCIFFFMLFLLSISRPPSSPLFPYTTLFRSSRRWPPPRPPGTRTAARAAARTRAWSGLGTRRDRKSTRLNSSHVAISYAVFCLKKKNEHIHFQHPLIDYNNYSELSVSRSVVL